MVVFYAADIMQTMPWGLPPFTSL